MKRILLLLLLTTCTCQAQTGIITTIAGTGSGSFAGDGGAASAASLYQPLRVCTDRSGNIVIADAFNNCIRLINNSGIMSTVAGTASAGYNGDNIAATAAKLNYPVGIATDLAGNIFISDRNNNRVRKVNASGIITTIAGTGTAGFSGDGGAASAAMLNQPAGIAVDLSGKVYIADFNNHRIRVVSTSGNISTYAGTGSSGYSGDYGVATGARLSFPSVLSTDENGSLYLCDSGNFCIRKVNPYGIINTIAGTGTSGFSGDGAGATIAAFAGPDGIAVNGIGEVFCTDRNNQRIRKIDTSGIITTVAGSGAAGFSGDGAAASAAKLSNPAGITVDNIGNLIIADADNNRLRYVVLNHRPVVATGHPTHLFVCESTTANAVDTALAVTDPDAGQRLTWMLNTAPARGSVGGFPTGLASTGTTVSPSGLTYTPTATISGNDSFTVRVTDGYASDTVKVLVHIEPLPNGGHVTGADSVCPLGGDTLRDIAATPGGTWSHSDTFIVLGTLPGSFTGISPGSEWVTYTVTTVCGTDSARLHVTVNPAPISGSITGLDSVCIGGHITLYDTTATPGGVWTTTDTSRATIAASGPNTAVLTAVGGGRVGVFYNAFTHCGSAPAYFEVYISPYAGAISGPDTVCQGSTIDLSDFVNDGLWASSATSVATIASWGMVTGVSPGTTTISYTVNSFRCGSATVHRPVYVQGSPTAGAISGAASVCAGDSVTLHASVGGGLWSCGATSIATIYPDSGVIKGLATGTTNVYYSVSNACFTTYDTMTFNVTGIPTVPTISGADSVCAGATAVAMGTPSGGAWVLSNGRANLTSSTASSQTVAGITSGTDTLTYTVTNSCGSTPVRKAFKIVNLPGAGTVTGPSSFCQGAAITLSDTAAGGHWSVSNPSVATIVATSGAMQGLAGGTVTVTYSRNNACGTNYVTHPVTIDPLPVAGVITGADSICPTGTTTLHDTISGGVFSASNNNATVSGSVVTGNRIGTDTIYYTVTNGCGAADTQYIIHMIAAPYVSVIAGPASVCSGGTITLTDSSAGGHWSVANAHLATINPTSGLVSGLAAGLDTVFYTINNPCAANIKSTILTVNPNPSAGIISGDSIVCPAASLALSDTTRGGVWGVLQGRASVTSGSVTGIRVGYDTVTYRVTTVCGSDIAYHTVHMLPLPDAGSVGGLSIVCPGGSITLSPTISGGSWSSLLGNTSVTSGIVTGIATGSDTIVYTVANACGSAESYKAVTVQDLVVPTVTPSVNPDSNVCFGSRVFLTANTVNAGSSPYVGWVKSGTLIGTGTHFSYYPTGADTVHCMVLGNSHCSSPDTIASRPVHITVSNDLVPVTNITASTTSSVIVVGTPVNFAATLTNCGSEPIYEWFLNGSSVVGATNPTFTIAATGNDSVWCLVTCLNTCVTTPYNHTNTIVVHTGKLGLEPLVQADNGFQLFPNPANNGVIISGAVASQQTEPVRYEIMDMTGRTLIKGWIQPFLGRFEERIELDDHFTTGRYLVRIVHGAGIEYLHFAVMK